MKNASPTAPLKTHITCQYGGFHPQTADGIITLENGTLSFTSSKENASFTFEPSGIKTFGRQIGTRMTQTYWYIRTKQNKLYRFYLPYSPATEDEINFRKWEATFKQAGVKTNSGVLLMLTLLTVGTVAAVIIFLLFKHISTAKS